MIFNFSFLSLSLSLPSFPPVYVEWPRRLERPWGGGESSAISGAPRHILLPPSLPLSLSLSLSLSGVYDYYHHFSRLFCLWFDSLISALLICKRVYRTINGGGLQVTMGAFGESIGHVGFIGVAPLIPRLWFFIIISPSSSSSPSPSSSSFYTTVLIVCHLLTFDLSLPFLLFFFERPAAAAAADDDSDRQTHTQTHRKMCEREPEKKTNKQTKEIDENSSAGGDNGESPMIEIVQCAPEGVRKQLTSAGRARARVIQIRVKAINLIEQISQPGRNTKFIIHFPSAILLLLLNSTMAFT